MINLFLATLISSCIQNGGSHLTTLRVKGVLLRDVQVGSYRDLYTTHVQESIYTAFSTLSCVGAAGNAFLSSIARLQKGQVLFLISHSSMQFEWK
jgi:hypothetical protein